MRQRDQPKTFVYHLPSTTLRYFFFFFIHRACTDHNSERRLVQSPGRRQAICRGDNSSQMVCLERRASCTFLLLGASEMLDGHGHHSGRGGLNRQLVASPWLLALLPFRFIHIHMTSHKWFCEQVAVFFMPSTRHCLLNATKVHTSMYLMCAAIFTCNHKCFKLPKGCTKITS